MDRAVRLRGRRWRAGRRCPPNGGCAGAPVHYERHRPEQSTLYRLLRQHAQSFFAQTEETTSASVPQFVKDEFEAFLSRGILAHGFLRLCCRWCTA